MIEPDWDNPHSFSIIVQGPLFKNNLVETANHCLHWRNLFPFTPLILAISVTDIITGTLQDSGQLDNLALTKEHQSDGELCNALFFLRQVCTIIAIAQPALPLPFFKKDAKTRNNINFQIAAARAGLDLVNSTYVLRVRSDLIFQDRSFLKHYEKDRTLPRGHANVLHERVMISWLYTLNPYASERLPLHYSDWFHLGRTDDVKSLWNVSPMSLADATYYKTHQYATGSNTAERLFLTRLAIEQHLLYSTFKTAFPSLQLDYHNDLRSRELCMDILLDNFIPCDLLKAKCFFEKYHDEFYNQNKRTQCITIEAWRALCYARNEDYRTVILKSAEEVNSSTKEANIHLAFSERYDALHLRLKNAILQQGEIVANSHNGTIIYGPYVTLPNGHYTARVACSLVTGPGKIILCITADSGQKTLAKHTITIPATTDSHILEIPFSVKNPKHDNIEIVLSIQNINQLKISYVDFFTATVPPTKTASQNKIYNYLNFLKKHNFSNR